MVRSSLFYASSTEVTLKALGKDEVVIDQVNALANDQPDGFTLWEPLAVESLNNENKIEKIRIIGGRFSTGIDDFVACKIGGVLPITIDVRPGSETNTVNLSASGVIPVAIRSTENFDAPLEIDPDSLRLAGATVQMVGRGDRELCHVRDVDGDALDDLVCSFENLLETETGDSTIVLEGETFFGVPIRGEDNISVVPDP